VWLSDLTALITQADQSHAAFEALKNRYPNSDVAQHPFSSGWRPHTGREPADEPTRLGLDWAWKMKHHGQTLQEFARKYGANFSKGATGRLLAYVTSWESPDIDARECLQILAEHKKDLGELQRAKLDEVRSEQKQAPAPLIHNAAPQPQMAGVAAVSGNLTVIKKPFFFLAEGDPQLFKWVDGISAKIEPTAISRRLD
jgi:hypothetical protein